MPGNGSLELERRRTRPQRGPRREVRPAAPRRLLGRLLGADRGEVVAVPEGPPGVAALPQGVPRGAPARRRSRRRAPKHRESPLAQLYLAGCQEAAAACRRRAARARARRERRRPAAGRLEAVDRAMRRAASVEISRMERYLPFLATTASAAPFIGLFGTVWGVMSAFHGIGQQGSASLAVVAPGISEALDRHRGRPRRGHPGGHGLQLLRQPREALGGGDGGLRARPAQPPRRVPPPSGGARRKMAFKLESSGRRRERPDRRHPVRDQHHPARGRDPGPAPDLHAHRAADASGHRREPAQELGQAHRHRGTAGPHADQGPDLYLNDKPVPAAALDARLRDAIKAAPTRPLYLKADQGLQLRLRGGDHGPRPPRGRREARHGHRARRGNADRRGASGVAAASPAACAPRPRGPALAGAPALAASPSRRSAHGPSGRGLIAALVSGAARARAGVRREPRAEHRRRGQPATAPAPPRRRPRPAAVPPPRAARRSRAAARGAAAASPSKLPDPPRPRPRRRAAADGPAALPRPGERELPPLAPPTERRPVAAPPRPRARRDPGESPRPRRPRRSGRPTGLASRAPACAPLEVSDFPHAMVPAPGAAQGRGASGRSRARPPSRARSR